MGTLRFVKSKEWQVWRKDIELHLDDTKLLTLQGDVPKEVQSSPGRHRIHAESAWLRSKELVIDAGETSKMEIKVSGYRYGAFLMALATLSIALYFGLKLFLSIEANWLFLFIAPGILQLLYFMTIGRNRYLVVQINKL